MFFTYILRSEKSNRFYIGHTASMEERLTYHNNGKVAATKGKGPWTIVYFESFQSKVEANRRELEIKAKKSRQYIERLLQQ